MLSHCCQFLLCFVTERKACNIYLHIHPNTAQQLQVRSAGFEALSSLELHPGGLNYSLALQRHTGQTAVLQAPTLGHYIYAFSKRFYLKRLTVHSGYTFFLSVCVFPGNWTHNLCAANAMLYHWATGTLIWDQMTTWRQKYLSTMFLLCRLIITALTRNGKTDQIDSFYTNYDSLSFDQNLMIFRKAQVKHQCFIDYNSKILLLTVVLRTFHGSYLDLAGGFMNTGQKSCSACILQPCLRNSITLWLFVFNHFHMRSSQCFDMESGSPHLKTNWTLRTQDASHMEGESLSGVKRSFPRGLSSDWGDVREECELVSTLCGRSPADTMSSHL